MSEVKLGVYKHFKGNVYEVIGIARHSESLEELIIYRNVNNHMDMWARPKAMFLSKKEVDGKMIQRFEYIG